MAKCRKIDLVINGSKMDVIKFVSILQGGKIILDKEIEMIEIVMKVGIYLCVQSDGPRSNINVSRIDLIEIFFQKRTEMAETAEADSVGREIGDKGGEQTGDKRNVIEIAVRMTNMFIVKVEGRNELF